MEWTERYSLFFFSFFFFQEILVLEPFKMKKRSIQGAKFWINSEQSKQPPYFPDSEWRSILSENDRRFWAGTARRAPGDNVLPDQFQTFSGTSQKAERRRPFRTGLVRHCPQGLFSPFFTFLRIFPPVKTFPRPHYLPLGLRGWTEPRMPRD